MKSNRIIENLEKLSPTFFVVAAVVVWKNWKGKKYAEYSLLQKKLNLATLKKKQKKATAILWCEFSPSCMCVCVWFSNTQKKTKLTPILWPEKNDILPGNGWFFNWK